VVDMDDYVSRAEFERAVQELRELRAQLNQECARRSAGRRVSPSASDAATMNPVGDNVEATAHVEEAPAVEASDDGVSRRGLLRSLGGAAVAGAGLAVAGSALAPESASAAPISGDSTSAATAGVTGTNTVGGVGGGNGVYGRLVGGSGIGINGAVVGDTDQLIGFAVGGVNSSGTGVHGESAGTGVGVEAFGGRANLHLAPMSFTGRPVSGAYVAGDVYVDATGAIFQCVGTGDFATSTFPVFMRIGFNAISPVRLVSGQSIAAGATFTVVIGGTSNIPIQASAATFILTVASSQAGALTIYNADLIAAPFTVGSIYPASQLVAGEVTARLGVGAPNVGKISILNRGSASATIFLDATGFYS
jgi:hypothetical protein